MSKEKGERKATMVYVDPRIKKDFQRLLFELDHVKCAGKPADQSNVTAALWLFFASLGQAGGEAFLAEWFPRLEKLMGEDAGRRGGEVSPGAEAGSGRADEATTLPAEGIEGRPAKKPNPRRKRAR